MHPIETAKAMRDTLREAGITTNPGRLALYVGGTAVSSAIGSAVLNLIHRTPWWLLVLFFLGLMVMAWGGIVVRADKKLSQGAESFSLTTEPVPEVRAPAPAPVTPRAGPTEYSRQPIFDQAPPELADLSQDSLKPLFVSRTEAQAKALMKQHAGKPVRVSGEIEDVSVASAYGGSVRLRGKSGLSFLLFFDAADKEAERQLLISLNTGDRLVVSGVIHDIAVTQVALDNSKLIDIRRHVS